MKWARPRVTLIGLVLTLILSLAATIQVPRVGAALQVRIAADASFDGNYRPGAWVPINVTIANDGAAVTGDVVLEVPASPTGEVRYVQRVELPTRSQKALTLYARADAVATLLVRFEAGQERVDAAPITLRSLRSAQQLIGMIVDDVAAGEELRRALTSAYGTTRIETVTLPPEEVPGNTFGLDSFSTLIVGDATTGRWSVEQRAALAGWVARGGTLLVSGGSNARKATEGLGELPPLRARDSRTVSGLGGLGSSTIAGQWVLATGDVIPEATRKVEQDGAVLVATRTWGRGTVTSFAFDPATAGFSAWPGAGSFWTGLALDTGLPASLQDPFDQGGSSSAGAQTWRITDVLSDLPSLSLPSTAILGLVLLAFIIMIGPVNYLVLRRLDRRELAWVTIPVLTILFTLAIYGYGATTKGRGITVSSVSIVRIAPDARAAELQAFYGIFTPSRGSRSFNVPADALFTGFSNSGLGQQSDLGRDVRFEQGGNGGVRDASFAQWTQRTVAAQAQLDPAPYAIKTELTWQGTKLVGTVTNTSAKRVEDVLLLYSNGYVNLGDLDPGASVPVNWQPVPTYSGNTNPAYRPGLGSTVYNGGVGSSYQTSRQSSNLGVDGRRADVLDALSGSVLAYNFGGATAVRPTPTTTPSRTATARGTGSPVATATPRATATTAPGSGSAAGSAGSGPVQLLFWRPDTPLELRIAAGDRQVTTLVIQELLPGGVR